MDRNALSLCTDQQRSLGCSTKILRPYTQNTLACSTLHGERIGPNYTEPDKGITRRKSVTCSSTSWKQHQLSLKPAKCKFFKTEMDYLGN